LEAVEPWEGVHGAATAQNLPALNQDHWLVAVTGPWVAVVGMAVVEPEAVLGSLAEWVGRVAIQAHHWVPFHSIPNYAVGRGHEAEVGE
jgi:hypothetical protein